MSIIVVLVMNLNASGYARAYRLHYIVMDRERCCLAALLEPMEVKERPMCHLVLAGNATATTSGQGASS